LDIPSEQINEQSARNDFSPDIRHHSLREIPKLFGTLKRDLKRQNHLTGNLGTEKKKDQDQ
jgi:hypothetical protein